MIINTGCRTDIPAFYSTWLMNRIREGFVYTRNPYNETQVTKYNLSPDVVDCLAFCTKNPEPMLKYLDELKIYRQYWFVTITPYEKAIDEKLNPPKRKNIREDCNCLMGNDIGAYNTCGHLCKYCYANASSNLVKENMKKHNPTSPFLIGKEQPGDKITEANQKSWIIENRQISFI